MPIRCCSIYKCSCSIFVGGGCIIVDVSNPLEKVRDMYALPRVNNNAVTVKSQYFVVYETALVQGEWGLCVIQVFP